MSSARDEAAPYSKANAMGVPLIVLDKLHSEINSEYESGTGELRADR